uniref:RRM domain-containing protein n=1 Tax=Steinernema glaseri TaxID=37863 RepID=A0A1I7YKL9_9BILA
MDKDLLQAFFDADSLESIQILSNTVPQGDYTQAEIIFNTTEQAQQALNDVDGIPIDDGEENQVLRLLNPAQYAVYDATPNLRPIAPGSSSPAKNESPHKPSVGPSTPPPVVDAPEV